MALWVEKTDQHNICSLPPSLSLSLSLHLLIFCFNSSCQINRKRLNTAQVDSLFSEM